MDYIKYRGVRIYLTLWDSYAQQMSDYLKKNREQSIVYLSFTMV